MSINQMPLPNLLVAKNLCVNIGGKEVLDHVELELRPGEIVTIVGPNGAGKSTLIKALIGGQRATKGNVWKSKELRIGYVPQKLQIDENLPMSAGRFIALMSRAKQHDILSLAQKCGVEQILNVPLHGLSGGQLQRVALVRALLNAPNVLILDEPTQGLDQPGASQFYALIEELRQETGISVLMVSHELHVVMSTSDRVICLNRHVCCQGSPEHVASAPEYRALFGSGTLGTLALYRHRHSHEHSLDGSCTHD